jgi:ribose 1,5-bisphosphate isomerase
MTFLLEGKRMTPSKSDEPLYGVDMPAFPDRAQKLIEEYENLVELGASRTIRMILEALTIVAQDTSALTTTELLEEIGAAARYFKRTRGRLTPSVENALDIVLEGIDGLKESELAEVQTLIQERSEAFSRESIRNTNRIAQSAADLIPDGAKVMAYDYSGTVIASLQKAADDGKSLLIIVPESRTLDGGRPIIEKVVSWGHQTHFIADAVIGYYMRETDIVIEGVEALFANGDFLGTPGTFTVGLLAKHFKVPFYALTETLKISALTLYQPFPETPNRWLDTVFDHPTSFGKPEAVSVASPGLERIPANFITAYITERGQLPPQAIWHEARRLFGEH